VKATTWMLLLAAGLMSTQAIGQMENETELKLRAGGFAEGERDLGLGGDEESSEFFGEIHGSLFTQYAPGFSTKLRVQAFYSTGEVFLNTDETPQPSDEYIALREAWIDIGAMTSFPGEVLRLGRQRIRDDDALWYDDDAVAARWAFDTTLLQASLGVAQQLEGFRTDDAGVDKDQEDRFYIFGDIGTQFRPGHFVELRVANAADDVDLEEEQMRETPERDRDRSLTWVGLAVHSDFHNERALERVAYWAEIMGVTGDEEYVIQPDPMLGDPVTFAQRDVSGVAGSFALRFRPSPQVPAQFGVMYSLGSGGVDSSGESETFEQTGLQSNRSRYTGTRSQIHRFSEAAQFELGNLHVSTVFASFPAEVFDISLIAHQFQRDAESYGVESKGLSVDPEPGGDDDIGRSYDIVVARYFEGFDRVILRESGPSGVLRLRASLFEPGDAYAADADSTYRAILEMSWKL